MPACVSSGGWIGAAAVASDNGSLAVIDMKSAVRVLRLALMITAVDLAMAIGYWGAQGVTPSRVVHSIAGWVVDADSLATPVARGVGVLVLYAIYFAMVGALALMLALRPVSPTRALPVGVLYGISAYLVCYQWIVPALIFPLPLSASPTWVAACLGVHAVCFGPWMVWVLTAPFGGLFAPQTGSPRTGLGLRIHHFSTACTPASRSSQAATS